MTLSKSTVATPTIVSPDPGSALNDDADDFGNDWGGFGEEDAKPPDDDPWAPAAPASSTSTTAFDDKGEPDFAGWLAAQHTVKKTTKNPLPKGLNKSSTASTTKSTRPTIGGRSSTAGSAATKRVVAPPKKATPKAEAPKKTNEEEEGWGDAW
jgi:SCY1-like protein 1